MILDIPEVGRIVKRGYRNTEMHVDINPLSLDSLSLSPDVIISALKNRNINFPGGNISNNGIESIVRTVGEFDTASEIEDVFLRTNDAGRYIRLKDVAKVKEDFEDALYLDKVNGLSSIVLTVLKREKGDAISLVDQVKKVVEEYQKTVKNEVEISYVNDMSKYIRRRLKVLLSNGFTGFFLVVASLFFFLGWRISVMVAVGLPLTIAMTFIAISYLGITLNLISMMGLIIVVGMLVDDAIIISENIYRLIEEGMEVREACIQGTYEVVSPVTATITTTVAAFSPLLFMSGIFGKFVYSIPLVVILALFSSLLEAFFVLPLHVYDITKNKTGKQLTEKKGKVEDFRNKIRSLKEKNYFLYLLISILFFPIMFDDFFVFLKDSVYKSSLYWCLRHKYKTILILNLVFLVVLGIFSKFGKFKLFPGAIEIFQVKLEAKTGLTLEETEWFARAIESEVSKLPNTELENFVTRIGIIQKDPNDPFTKRGKNFAQLIVYLTPDSSRERSTEDVINALRKKTFYLLNEESKKAYLNKFIEEEKRIKKLKEEQEALYRSGKMSFLSSMRYKVDQMVSKVESKKKPFTYDPTPEQFKKLEGKLVSLDYEKLQGGPPVGKPIAIEVLGDDFETIKKIVAEYKNTMQKVDGVADISDDFISGKDEIQLKIDEKLASLAGISIFQIATAVNTAFNGTVATTIKRADEEVDVRVRFPEEYRNSIKSLDKLYVMNRIGNLIPVSKMISYTVKPGVVSINHLDGKRLITATANVDETKTTSREANGKIKKLAAGIIQKYPGYRVRFGGENKDTEESMASLGRAFLVAFIFIFMILASLFGSFVQPVIVVSAIPFAFIGVVLAFVLHDHYFSFLSMIGIVGLSGIVVNDSIVLVDFANKLRSENPDATNLEICLKAGIIRLRPVILTTVTTVLGILPTAYGIGGEDPFLVPMALAIGWGLAFSSALILIIIPVLYCMTHDWKDRLKGIKRKGLGELPQLSGENTESLPVEEKLLPEASA